MANTPSEQDARDLQAYYDGLKAERKKLIVPLVSITLFLYFFQQIATNFTSLMDGFIADNVTIAFAYTVAMFFVVVTITMIYSTRMNKIETQFTPHNLDEISARYEPLDDDTLADVLPGRQLVENDNDISADPAPGSTDGKDAR